MSPSKPVWTKNGWVVASTYYTDLRIFRLHHGEVSVQSIATGSAGETSVVVDQSALIIAFTDLVACSKRSGRG